MEKTGTVAVKAPAGKASTSKGAGAKSAKKLKVAVGSEEKSTKEADEELFKEFSIGQTVWVISKGIWHKANIKEKGQDTHPVNPNLTVPTSKIHYPGWGVRYDEWVMSDSIMEDTPENEQKAVAENVASGHKETSSGRGATKKKTEGKKQKKVSAKQQKASAKSSAKSVSKETSQPPSVEPPPPSKKAGSSDDDETVVRKRSQPSKIVVQPSKLIKPSVPKRPSRAASTATMDTVPPSPATEPVSGVKEEDMVISQDEAGAPEEKPPSNTANSPPASPAPSSAEVKSEAGPGDDASSAAGGPPSVARVEETPAKDNSKPERSFEDFSLLCDHYDDYDPSKPDEKTPEEKLLMMQILQSIGTLPEEPSDSAPSKTPEEREKTCLDSLRKLSYITLAKRQKALDTAILKVTLPAGLKRLMAENYIQTVRCAKLLKQSKPEYSSETILKTYRDYCEKNPRADKSIYWNKARLAEMNLLQNPEVFDGVLQTFLLRHEWPQLEDWRKQWKKDKTEAFRRYGFLHLARYIQLMSYHHNTEAKRLVGKLGQQLIAIYDDLLEFIDKEYVAKLTDADLDELYTDMDPAYIGRIRFLTYGSVANGDRGTQRNVLHTFHMLSDAFFEELLKTDEATIRGCGLKVVWKKVSSPAIAGDS